MPNFFPAAGETRALRLNWFLKVSVIYAVCFVAAAISTEGQEIPPAERLRDLNAQVLQVQDRLQGGASREQQPLASAAVPVFRQRFDALRDLIVKRPQEALLVAFPSDVLDSLARSFPQAARYLEAHGSWRAPVEYLIVDGVKFTSSSSVISIRVNKQRFFLHFADSNPPPFKSGDLISITGVRAGDRIAVEQLQVTEPLAASCSTTGAQNIVVILANLKSYSLPASVTTSYMSGVMLGNSGGGAQSSPDYSVDDFWQQNSDGKAWVNRTGAGALKVLGPYTLPADYNTGGVCDYNGIVAAATAAADPSVNFQDYNRTIIVLPPNNACNWGGLGTVGCWAGYCPGDGSCSSSWSLLRSDGLASRAYGVMVATHELGHNLTLGHSQTLDYGSVTIGPLGSAGVYDEYGDRLSTMGNWNLGFYNADHAINQLGWLQPNTNYLDVSTSGSYSIQWFGTRSAGVKALRIQRGSNAQFIIESRQNRGIYDPTLYSQIRNGALIHYRDSTNGYYSRLLDFTPNSTSSDFSDPALVVGKSWTDPYTSTTLRVDSLTNGMLNMTVTYASAPCTRGNPTVSLNPLNPSTPAGSPVTYTLTVTNTDSQACSPATFSLSSPLPVGWTTGSFSPTQLTINPGGTATATFSKTPPGGTGVGTYTVSAEARNIPASLYRTATASCTVLSAHSISGQVKVGSTPLSGVTVALSGTNSAATVTNSTGNFSFTNLTLGGNYVVTPTRASYTFTPANQSVNNLSGNQTANFAATLLPPGVPAAVSPASGATGVSLTPALSWIAGSGATSHEIYFGTTSPPPFVVSTTGLTYVPGVLTSTTTYYWKIVAKNSAGTTSSPIWSFTTQLLAPPPVPTSPFPGNGATNTSLAVQLSWQASLNASSYDVYLGTTPSPSFAGNVGAASYQPATPLMTGTKYYWKVVAKNAAGTGTSPVWIFTTSSIPKAPTNLSPVNGATGVSRTPTLQWSAALGATKYDVYFGTSSNPALVVANTTATTYKPAGTLSSRARYYWRVVAKSATGQASSSTVSFTTQ